MKLTLQQYKFYIKQILTIASPIIISQIGTQLTSIFDTIMVGHVSSTHLGAAAVANYLYLIPFLFGLGLSIGITPIVGQANGAGKIDEVKNLFVDSIYFSIINAVFITVIMLIIGLFIPYLNFDKEITELAIPYYNWISISFIAISLLGGFKQYLDGIELTIYGMLATIIGNIFNIFLNWVLIFGKLGAPKLELTGTGIATCISRFISFLFILLIVLYSKKLKNKIKRPRLKLFALKKLKDIYKTGINIGTQYALEMSAFSFIGIMTAWIGTIEIAAYNITQNLVTLFYLGITGIAAANTIIISNYIGNNNKKNVVESSYCMLLVTILITICSVIIIYSTRNILPYVYTNDIEVLKIVPILLTFAALFHIPDAIAGSILGILRGFINVKVPTLIQTISYWAFMIPFIYIISFKLNFGVYGVTFGLVIGIGICCIALYLWYRYILKQYLKNN